MTLKQVILVRHDLKLPKGKLAVQVAHASVDAVLASDKKLVAEWLKQGGKKVVLKVSGLDELAQFEKKALDKGFVTALVADAGHTVLKPGTVTCLAIGPGPEAKVNLLTKELKMV